MDVLICTFCLETKSTISVEPRQGCENLLEKCGSLPQQNKLAALKQCFVFGLCSRLHFSGANFQGQTAIELKTKSEE